MPDNQKGGKMSGLGFILVASIDSRLRVFDLTSSQAVCVMSINLNHSPSSIALSPDNQLLAVGGISSQISIWCLQNKKQLKQINNPYQKEEDDQMDDYDPNQMQILDLNWSLDGKYLAACRAS